MFWYVFMTKEKMKEKGFKIDSLFYAVPHAGENLLIILLQH